MILLFTLVRTSSFWEVKFVSVVQSSVVYSINIQGQIDGNELTFISASNIF